MTKSGAKPGVNSAKPVYRGLFNLIFMLYSLLCILPIALIVSISFTDADAIYNKGFTLFPSNPTTLAYRFIFRYPEQILKAYGVSVAVTLLGLVISLLVISMIAYPLSRPDFRFRNHIAFIVFFTMLFNGGMIPWYIVCSAFNKAVHINNTVLALIFPYVAGAFNILILRTSMQTIPLSLIESAKIDGASEMKVFTSIILPLSKPGLATVGLFIVLGYWNDWWLSMMFTSDTLIPLQLMLARIMSSLEFLTSQMSSSISVGDVTKNLPSESARMAMCVLAAGPMLFVFPFFQKYFIRGLIIGSVKG